MRQAGHPDGPSNLAFATAAVSAATLIAGALKYTSVLEIRGGLLGVAFFPLFLASAWIAVASIP
jgi:hypothetical protein